MNKPTVQYIRASMHEEETTAVITMMSDPERGEYIAFLQNDPSKYANSYYSETEAIGRLVLQLAKGDN